VLTQSCMPSTPHQPSSMANQNQSNPLNSLFSSEARTAAPTNAPAAGPGFRPAQGSAASGAPAPGPKNQTRHVVFTGQNGGNSTKSINKQHLGPLSKLIAEQRRLPAKNRGSSGGSKGHTYGKSSSVPANGAARRSTSGKGKLKRKRSAGAQNGGKKQQSLQNLWGNDTNKNKVSINRKQYGSLQAKGRRHTGNSSKEQSQERNARLSNLGYSELAYYS